MKPFQIAAALLAALSPAFCWGKRAHGHLASAAWRAWTHPAKGLLDEGTIRQAAETTDGHPDYPPQDHVFYPETFHGFTGGAVMASGRAQEKAREAFLSGDYQSASEYLGRLAHIVSDISQPFHTTREGATSRNPGHAEMDSYSNSFFERSPPTAYEGKIPARSVEELSRRTAQEALAYFPQANASPADPALLERLGGLAVSSILSAWDLALPPQKHSPVVKAPLAREPASSSRLAPAPGRSEEGKLLTVLPTPPAGPFTDTGDGGAAALSSFGTGAGKEAFYAFFGIKPRLIPVASGRRAVVKSRSSGIARAILSAEETERPKQVKEQAAPRGGNHAAVSLGGIPLEPGATYRLRLITSPVGHALLEVIRQ